MASSFRAVRELEGKVMYDQVDLGGGGDGGAGRPLVPSEMG